MAIYCVVYDLKKQGQNYNGLIEKLKSFGSNSLHLQGSVWLVSTSGSAVALRDYLTPAIDSNDSLAVFGLTKEYAWKGLGAAAASWIKQNLG